MDASSSLHKYAVTKQNKRKTYHQPKWCNSIPQPSPIIHAVNPSLRPTLIIKRITRRKLLPLGRDNLDLRHALLGHRQHPAIAK